MGAWSIQYNQCNLATHTDIAHTITVFKSSMLILEKSLPTKECIPRGGDPGPPPTHTLVTFCRSRCSRMHGRHGQTCTRPARPHNNQKNTRDGGNMKINHHEPAKAASHDMSQQPTHVKYCRIARSCQHSSKTRNPAMYYSLLGVASDAGMREIAPWLT